MENTLENKAKFLAQYWGQKVVYFNEINLVTRDIQTPSKINPVYIAYPCIKYAFLELKPLSSITDEDVLKIAECVLWRNRMISESAVIVQTKEFLLQSSKIFTLRSEEWADVIDKVRELGYAYRWNGLTVEKLVEYGWVKQK